MVLANQIASFSLACWGQNEESLFILTMSMNLEVEEKLHSARTAKANNQPRQALQEY